MYEIPDATRSWREQSLTVGQKSVLAVEFPDTRPNYYYIVNMSPHVLYCSVLHIPSASRYEEKVRAGETRLIARADGYKRLSIYNDGTSDANIRVMSYEGEFNPAAMVNMNVGSVEISNLDEASFDGIIKGFSVPLPTGTNNIGKVDVATLPSAITTAINNIQTSTSKISPSRTLSYSECTSASTSPATLALSIINFLTNDSSTSDLVVTISDGGNSHDVRLKAGETLQDFEIGRNMQITIPTGSVYRVLGGA